MRRCPRHGLVVALALALACVGSAGCRRPEAAGGGQPSPSAASPSAAVASSASSASEAAPTPSRGGVTEADARAVLSAWLAAQNAGDFEAYGALYAPRFEGVRRSGSQTARLDRARWMKERAVMFRAKTEVSATDVTVATTQDGATLSFTQAWSQATYRDEGPKRMVLTRTDGRLLVAREEMLRSNVLSAAATSQRTFAFVVRASGPAMVLDAKPKDEWLRGAPVVISRAEPVVVRHELEVGKLPEEVKAAVGRRVELFGPSGRVCAGVTTGLAVVGRVVPHFGVKARWTGTGDFEGEPRPPESEIAAEAWALSEGGAAESGRLLVAAVRPDEGRCEGALWARLEGPSPPTLVASRPASAALRDRALAELRKTKAYVEAQARYVSEKAAGDPARWEDFEATTKVVAFPHPTGTVVSVAVRAGAGCGTFGAMMSASWIERGGVLSPFGPAEAVDELPRSVGDIDGDGELDLVFEEALLRGAGGKAAARVSLPIPFLDCDC